jgi:hypothetical protein
MNLSIIIVNYNTKELLFKCLQSITRWCEEEFTTQKYEVIVVDNGSTDGSVDEIQNSVKIIKNETNLGFAKANNIGIKAAQGQNILLLNSDTEVNSLAIQKTLNFLEEFKGDFKGKIKGEIGVATCKILLTNGKIDPSCHRGFPTPWNAFCYFLKLEKCFAKFKLFSGYHQYYKDLSSIHEVDAISGAFFMIRRDVIDVVGLLDEDYFMYGEDLDWCYRIKAAGYRIMYNPSYSIVHHKKKSGRQSQDSALQKRTQRYFWQTMRIFYEKHYLKKYPQALNFIVLKVLKLLS